MEFSRMLTALSFKKSLGSFGLKVTVVDDVPIATELSLGIVVLLPPIIVDVLLVDTFVPSDVTMMVGAVRDMRLKTSEKNKYKQYILIIDR
jgi:hypothetical protein